MKMSSKCSNLSFRPLKVGMVVDNAFGSLGSPMFCWVTYRSDSSNLSTMWSGYFWLGAASLMTGAVFRFGETLLSPCVGPDSGATHKYLLAGKMDQVQSNQIQPL